MRCFHSTLLITHHLLVVEHLSDRIAVMYLGKIVEIAKTKILFSVALHSYTVALLSAIPYPYPDTRRKRIILSGDVPNPSFPPGGFRFQPRCWLYIGRCKIENPPFEDACDGHFVACHMKEDVTAGYKNHCYCDHSRNKSLF